MRLTSTILFFLIALAYAGTSTLASKAGKFIPQYKLQVMDAELAKAHAQAVKMMEVTSAPTMEPTAEPSFIPTATPTVVPTVVPTFAPSVAPTFAPSVAPTFAPSVAPSLAPSVTPSVTPTQAPTLAPSLAPTQAQGTTVAPTSAPTPEADPTTTAPTLVPTVAPTTAPTLVPTVAPTTVPTQAPTTAAPSQAPTLLPTKAPSLTPAPTTAPTKQTQPILTFQSTVGLKGVSGDTLTQADKDAVVQSCAAAMDVSSTSVTFVSYSVSTARKLRSASKKSNIALLSNFDVVISTSVPTTSGSANTDYTQLTSKLTADNINANLQTYAIQNGASSLLTASADAVQSEPPTIQEPNNNNDNNLSGGAIAGIVIGVVVGVGLLVGLLWYFLAQRESTGLADKSKLDIDVGL